MSSVFVVVCGLLCVAVFGVLLTEASPLSKYFKKSSIDCVGAEERCFNTEECCAGFTCAAVDSEDDSAETPGRCIRAKNLTPCSTDADCADADEFCSSLSDAHGQSYCLPTTSNDNPDDLQQMLEAKLPGKHQAYSRQLAEYGSSCVTSDDCRPYVQLSDTTKVRVCCQQVRRGRQGNRRICDRITPISICIRPSM